MLRTGEAGISDLRFPGVVTLRRKGGIGDWMAEMAKHWTGPGTGDRSCRCMAKSGQACIGGAGLGLGLAMGKRMG